MARVKGAAVKKKGGSIVAKMSRSTETKHIGDEPKEGSTIQSQIELIRAYNYYNYFYQIDEGRIFLEKYLENERPELVKLLSRVPNNNISTTVCWIARLLNRRVILPQTTLEFFNSRLDELVKFRDREEVQREKKEVSQDSHNPRIAELETRFDDFFRADYTTDFKPSEWYRNEGVGPQTLKEIVAFYSPLYDELQAVGSDPQLKEAYAHLTRAKLTAYKQLVLSVIEAAGSSLENRKRQRKPRKKKAPSADKLLAKLKYLKDDRDTNLVSIAPEKILSSDQLWVFDTGNRVLTCYVAEKGKKFGVSGTTLLNVSLVDSFEKKLRKSHESAMLQTVTGAGKREIKAQAEKLSTQKKAVTSSRLNAATLILRAFSS